MGGGGLVLKFRTFLYGGGVVCKSSDVRKILKKSKFQNFSEQPRRQQTSLFKSRSLKQGELI